MKPLNSLVAPLAALALCMPAVADAAQAKRKPGAAAASRAARTLRTEITNYAQAVTYRDNGHVLGNPEATNRLVEYVSYTCSHCYEFSKEGDPVIRLFLVPKGNVSYEIRHSLRDIIDLTATMATHCGDEDKFPANHEAMMAGHPEWMAQARKATQAQMTRWNNGTLSARLRAIASDLGFYDIMENRGYSRAELDRCLTDEAKANALAETSERDAAAMKITGTPSFALNGKLLEGVHGWPALRPVVETLD